MQYTGTYALVLILHLLGAIFVIGPLAVAAVTAPRMARAGRSDALQAASRTTLYYGVASIVVVALGTLMVGLGDTGESWEMSQLWISASYAMWILALVLTFGLVVPAQRAALKALAAGDSAKSTVGRMAAGGGLAMLAWTVIVVLMVTKPGA